MIRGFNLVLRNRHVRDGSVVSESEGPGGVTVVKRGKDVTSLCPDL